MATPQDNSAHDLRNSLSVIISNCELMAIGRTPAADYYSRLNTILSMARRCLLICDLMILPDREFIHSADTIKLLTLTGAIQLELERRSLT